MKIAVIGLYFASNLGDAVICDCVAKWFRDAYPSAGVDVIDIIGNTEFEEQQTVSLRILRKRQKNLEKDYQLTRSGINDKVYYWSSRNTESRMEFYEKVADRKYDLAVFAGGQLFMDWLSLDVCEFLKHFERTNTPVLFNACGVGISISAKIREQMVKYLNSDNIHLISTRDDMEKIRERYLLNGKKAISTFDPALWTAETYGEFDGIVDGVSQTKPDVLGELKESELNGDGLCTVKSDVIGLGVMYCNEIPMCKLIRFWIRIIKELNRKQIPWKMFCNGDIHDYNLGCAILKILRLDRRTYIYPYPEVPEQLVKQIISFKALISFRLHSHIIAASYDIPAIALVWDDKLRFFYRHLGHPERCMTVEDVPGEVVRRLETAMEEGYDRELIETQKKYSYDLLLKEAEKLLKK